MKDSTFFGIDLHAKQSWFEVRAGKRPVFSGSVPNDWSAIERVLDLAVGRRIAAVEAGGNWPWLVYGLQDRGVEVRLLHPPSVTPYRQTRAKTDRIDAALLCRLASEPWRVKESWICPEYWAGVRLALRTREQLVDMRTAVRNRLHALLRQLGRRPPVGCIWGPTGAAWLKEQVLPVGGREALQSLRRVEQVLQTQDQALLEVMQKALGGCRPVQSLLSLPQCGPVTALTVCIESGDIARFRNRRSYVAHCALAPATSESGGKHQRRGLSRRGNQRLKKAYTEWAFRLLIRNPKLAADYDDAPNFGQAKAMLGRKLAGAVRNLLLNDEPFSIERLGRRKTDVGSIMASSACHP